MAPSTHLSRVHYVWRSLLNSLSKAGFEFAELKFAYKAVSQYSRFSSHLFKHHGALRAFMTLKEVEARLKRLALRIDIDGNRHVVYPIWTKTDRYGVPRRLSYLRRLVLRRRDWSVRFGMAIASSYRAFEATVSPQGRFPVAELSNSKWTLSKPEFMESLSLLLGNPSLKRLSMRELPLPTSTWLTSASASTKVSIRGACIDAWALLRNDPILLAMRKMYLACSKSEDKTTRWDNWLMWLEALSAMRATTPKSTRLSKFCWVQCRGGKVRGVTPTNYVLQSFLRQYHDYFMGLLRGLRTDCSFDEERGLRKLKSWTSEGRPCFSSDIPDATTQFPLAVMGWVVEGVLGRTAAQAWLKIMRVPVDFGGEIGLRPFSRGAPMGIYCMWPVFTLAHHTIVYMAARRAGVKGRYNDYVIRGDDNCIAHSDVGLKYLEIWRDLGQSPSPAKSINPFLDGYGLGEFAKRNFRAGKMILDYTYGEVLSASLYDGGIVSELLLRVYPPALLRRGERMPTPAVCTALLRPGGYRSVRKALSQMVTNVALGRSSPLLEVICPDLVDPILAVGGAHYREELKAMADVYVLDMVQSRTLSLVVWITGSAPQKLYEICAEDPETFKPRAPDGRLLKPMDGAKHLVSRKYRYREYLELLPLVRHVYNLADSVAELVSVIGDASTANAYHASLLVRHMRELEGVSEGLRVESRKSTRSHVLSRSLPRIREVVESYYDFHNMLVADSDSESNVKPMEYLDPANSTLLALRANRSSGKSPRGGKS